MNTFVEHVVRRLRSDLPAAPGDPLQHAIGDTFGVMYAAPLALIGLVWLCSATDVSVIARVAESAAGRRTIVAV
jgi:hypothetical protein